MKITKISINNFRNVTHAEYELGDLNIFAGANKQGKTNTILAVYWALADCLFDGSSDYASFKPIGNESETVSVELEFDNNFKLKKSFEENWVKTRGTDEKVMQGHITSYEINDTKYKTNKEAIEGTKAIAL
ncbi:MAG: AAA family ATPase, partial [Longicatena sp.]